MDPFTLAAGAAAFAGLGAAWGLRGRVRQAEAEVARLREELRAERHAASHDPLTGLPNRRAFYQIGAALIADPGRPPLVAVVLDLDDFKQVNDRFGHAAGDQVLITVAWRFAAYAGDNLIARLGGDEFAGLLAGAANDGWLRQSARRLAEMLAAPIRVAERDLRITASIGLVPVNGGAHLTEALSLADAAMYRAKASRARVGGTAGRLARADGDAAWGACDSARTAPDTAGRRGRFALGVGPHIQPRSPDFDRPVTAARTRQLIETTPGAEPGGQ